MALASVGKLDGEVDKKRQESTGKPAVVEWGHQSEKDSY